MERSRVSQNKGTVGILSIQGNLNPEMTLVVTTVMNKVSIYSSWETHEKRGPSRHFCYSPSNNSSSQMGPQTIGRSFGTLSSLKKLAQIRVLQKLKVRIESENGIDLPAGLEDELPLTA